MADRLCETIRELFEEVLPPGWHDATDFAKEEAEKVFFTTKKGSIPWEPSERKPFTAEQENQAALKYARILFQPYADLLSSRVEDPEQLKTYLEFAIHLVSVEAFERTHLYRPTRGSFVYGESPDQLLRAFKANVTAMLTRRMRSLIRAARKRKKEQAVTLGAAGRPIENPTPASPTAEQGDSTSGGISQGRRASAPRSITNKRAAERVAAYIESGGLTQTEFATKADTTPKTLRNFLKTGKVRIPVFEAIARAISMDKESLLKECTLPE